MHPGPMQRAGTAADDDRSSGCPAPPMPGGSLLPDVPALADTVQRARVHLGEALLAIDVYALGDGQPITGFNTQPRWAAYLAQLTGRLTETLANCGLPAAGSYYLIDLDAPQSLLVVPGRTLQWSVLFDASQRPLGPGAQRAPARAALGARRGLTGDGGPEPRPMSSVRRRQ